MKIKSQMVTLSSLLFLPHNAIANSCDNQWDDAWNRCDKDYPSKPKACYFLAEKYKPTCTPSNSRIAFDRYANASWDIWQNSVQVQGRSYMPFQDGQYARANATLKFVHSGGGYKIFYTSSKVDLLCNEQHEDKIGVEAIIDVNKQPVRFIQRKSCGIEPVEDFKGTLRLKTILIHTYQVATEDGFNYFVNALNTGPLIIGTEHSDDYPFKNNLERELAKGAVVHLSNKGWREKINEMNSIQKQKKSREKSAL